mgnify:CR=1 FL=1
MTNPMTKLFAGAALTILSLAVFAQGLGAHPFGGVFQKTFLYPMGDSVVVEYQTHMGRDVLLTLVPDRDKDGRLSEPEKDLFLKRLSKILIPNLSASLDQSPLPVLEMDRRMSLENRADYLEGATILFSLKIPIKNQGTQERAFRFEDHNFLAKEMDRLNYFHGILGESRGSRLLDNGRGIEILLGETGRAFPQESNRSWPQGTGNDPAKDLKGEGDLLSRYFTENQSGLKLFLFALIGAFVLGAGHALSPGHGKAMVAAYLVGSRGKVIHAVFLGLIVTLTHVASVVLLGIAALFLSEYFMPQTLLPWLGGISGAMIFLIGYWMLAKKALHNIDHSHHHHHPDPGKQGISFGSLLSMGIAGGMVPCPSALVVLLLSLSFSRAAEGLVLIFFFSLGLAAVLILVGILTVTASKFSEKFSETRTWIQRLPVFSAGVIMVIGMVIVVRSFL